MFSCATYLGVVPHMSAKRCVGLHVQCSFLLYDLTKTGICRHIFSIRYGAYSFSVLLMSIMDRQTEGAKLIGVCLNIFILYMPGKKKESAWLYTSTV